MKNKGISAGTSGTAGTAERFGPHFTVRFITVLTVFLLMAGFSAAARADGNDFKNQPPPPRKQFFKMKQKINTLRIWGLTKELDLDQDAAARVFPIMNGYDNKRTEIQYRLIVLMHNLRNALRDRDDAGIQATLDKLEANHQKMEQLNDSERDELKKALTVEQQAKFLLFEVRFEKQVKKMIAKARQRRGKAGQGLPE